MNTLKIMTKDPAVLKLLNLPGTLPDRGFKFIQIHPFILFLLLLLLWFLMPGWLMRIDQNTGTVDHGIWLLVLLSLISFLIIIALCWWLIQQMWKRIGLPPLQQMVLQFNTLLSWQQLSFYWGSFALLLLAASMIFIAIC